MMKQNLAMLPVLAIFLMGASPRGSSFITATPMPDFSPAPRAVPRSVVPPGFAAAPTPDQDAFLPTKRATNDASVTPGFFSRRDQYRGEGLSSSSSAQVQQERKVLPGAGIVLNMPLH